MTTWTMTARWVFPVTGPPLERGVVTVGGERIVAVEPCGGRCADVDLGNAALLPGLVNAHTHLDLSGLRGRCPPTPDFTGWLRQVIAHRRSQTPAEVQQSITEGLAESVHFGTTLIGDISTRGLSWTRLRDASLRAVVFYELLGLSELGADLAWTEALLWLAEHPAEPTWRPGLSPHAPYSVRSSLFSEVGTAGVPVAVHLAETRDEIELLAERRGPFVSFLSDLNVWNPDGLVNDPGEILRLLSGPAPVVVAHGNFLPPSAPVPANATVVYCPRTHAAFGHLPHPFRQFLGRGIRVALGTDSLASNPDIDLLAEARFLHRKYPDVAADELLRMATLNGAAALGWQDETGSLTAGKSADAVVLPLPDEDAADPHCLVFASALPPRAVLYRGRWTVGGPS